MAETVTIVSRPRSKKPAIVSASALAQHLDCSRTYVGKLEAGGVIQRQGDSFPLDQSRVAFLRRVGRQSPRSEADADHVKVKTEMLQLRLTHQRLNGGFHRISHFDHHPLQPWPWVRRWYSIVLGNRVCASGRHFGSRTSGYSWPTDRREATRPCRATWWPVANGGGASAQL